MDWQTELSRLRDWALNAEGHGPKAMWAILAIAGGFLIGAIISRLLGYLARRASGLAHRKDTEQARQSADNIVVDILGSVIRAMCILGGLAVAADVYGYYDIERAQTLAIAACKGLAILVAIWFIGSWLSSRIRRFGEKVDRRGTGSSLTLFAFLGSIVKFAALAVGAIAALQQFGFPIASLVAVIGAAGLAIALSLQDTLKAVAAGVVIAILRPYRIGDFVQIGGQTGTVTDITPFTTVLNTIDNKRVVITNDKAWGETIENYNANPRRRIDEIIGISYDDDIRKAMKIVERVVTNDPRALSEPPFWVKVQTLNDWSVDLRFRIWCKTPDYLDFRGDMLQQIKEAFDEGGVTIPYPHQVEIAKDGAKFVLAQQVDPDDQDDETHKPSNTDI